MSSPVHHTPATVEDARLALTNAETAHSAAHHELGYARAMTAATTSQHLALLVQSAGRLEDPDLTRAVDDLVAEVNAYRAAGAAYDAAYSAMDAARRDLLVHLEDGQAKA